MCWPSYVNSLTWGGTGNSLQLSLSGCLGSWCLGEGTVQVYSHRSGWRPVGGKRGAEQQGRTDT